MKPRKKNLTKRRKNKISIFCELTDLGPAMISGRLPNIEHLGISPDETQHIIRHQSIIKDEIGPLDRPHRLQRQQLRVTRPGPHQRHAPRPAAAAAASCLRPLGGPQGLQQPLELWQLQRDLILPIAEVLVGRNRQRDAGSVNPAISSVSLG